MIVVNDNDIGPRTFKYVKASFTGICRVDSGYNSPVNEEREQIEKEKREKSINFFHFLCVVCSNDEFFVGQ